MRGSEEAPDGVHHSELFVCADVVAGEECCSARAVRYFRSPASRALVALFLPCRLLPITLCPYP